MSPPIRTETLRKGAIERVTLDRPKGNILDEEMVGALTAHVRSLEGKNALKLLVVQGEGAHFSFGASVQEHLPDRVAGMLAQFHELFRARERLGVPTAAVVRGSCLGGGFELALSCGWVFAQDDAQLGAPEVKLGVFAPVASLLLPWRTKGGVASHVLVTGETIDAQWARELGIVDNVSGDPAEALDAWFERSLAPHSAVAVRHAWRAARRPIARALETDLPELEQLYLGSLMAHRDPVEGLNAFLGRRAPRWEHA